MTAYLGKWWHTYEFLAYKKNKCFTLGLVVSKMRSWSQWWRGCWEFSKIPRELSHGKTLNLLFQHSIEKETEAEEMCYDLPRNVWLLKPVCTPPYNQRVKSSKKCQILHADSITCRLGRMAGKMEGYRRERACPRLPTVPSNLHQCWPGNGRTVNLPFDHTHLPQPIQTRCWLLWAQNRGPEVTVIPWPQDAKS